MKLSPIALTVLRAIPLVIRAGRRRGRGPHHPGAPRDTAPDPRRSAVRMEDVALRK